MSSLKLAGKQLSLIRSILHAYLPNATIWGFGSRVHQRNLKPFSDLDLVIYSPEVSENLLFRVQEAFDDSDLAISVDISRWSQLPLWLQRAIAEEHINIV